MPAEASKVAEEETEAPTHRDSYEAGEVDERSETGTMQPDDRARTTTQKLRPAKQLCRVGCVGRGLRAIRSYRYFVAKGGRCAEHQTPHFYFDRIIERANA